MSDINQDDIDKLLSGGLDGIDDPAPASAGNAAPVEEGPASQDDIDALFAAVGGGADSDFDMSALTGSGPAETDTTSPETEEDGVASQGDIDALFAAVGGSAPEPVAAGPEASAPALPLDMDTEGMADQNDIDALFAAVGMSAPEPAAEVDTETLPGEPQPDESSDISALLDAIEAPADVQPAGSETPDSAKADTVDMSELLNQLSDAAPPAVEKPSAAPVDYNASTMILPTAALSAPPPAPPPPPPAPAMQAQPQPQAVPLPGLPAQPLSPPPSMTQLRDSLSIMSSAGEVESMSSQISGMLGQLSEKAHRYMQAWISSDSEAKELRARLLNEEHLRAVAIGERDAFSREVEVLRGRIGSLEGERIGSEEARRTAESALQTQIRELESRAKVQEAEIESLKNELTRSRTEATGVDIESRRARFEADRLKSEIESERMERMRIQRALENREKELQAMQAQAAGQASSLFIDELHRLVRRLESERDARGSGAHEALRQLDRLEYPESMVPVVANLRASLMQALGANNDDDDALKSLGREADRVRGPQAVAPGKTEMLSFESALSTFNLTSALEIAGALLREVKATPSALMRRIYQSPALRRPEVGEHLADLARLLEGLRTVQESADRARGSESGESEVFYVQMFDFLHNLVRLKLVNRLTGEVWRIFLDLRGRFSFVTSDKQWADYRDGVLGDKVAR